LPKIVTAGIGTGVAALLAAIAYFSFSRNGLPPRSHYLTFPLQPIYASDEITFVNAFACYGPAAPFFFSRNQKRRIVPSISLSGSVIAAFHDLFVEDPGFESIQGTA
jgi:hypothetical protein